MFNRVYRLEIQSSHGGIFDPALQTIAPLTFSPPSQSQTTLYHTACDWEWVRVLSCVGDTILQESSTLYLIRFKTHKVALDHSKEKLGAEGGLRPINNCRKVLLQVNFLDNDIWHCFLSVLSFYGLTHGPMTHSTNS
jgi:hypothetical protein